jgi:hypothetical protein
MKIYKYEFKKSNSLIIEHVGDKKSRMAVVIYNYNSEYMLAQYINELGYHIYRPEEWMKILSEKDLEFYLWNIDLFNDIRYSIS